MNWRYRGRALIVLGALPMRFGTARMGLLALAALWAAPALAQDDPVLDDAAALAAIPPAFEAGMAAGKSEGPFNLLIAAHRTTAQRYSDSYLTSGRPRRRSVATSMRLRRQDDANFSNRTRWLARRLEAVRASEPPDLATVSTGDEFLRVLVDASRRAPIGNLVIYGHAAANALFMREDRGFYGSVEEVARETRIVEGTEDARASQLRAMGARDLADLMELVASGDIRFAKNAVIFFAGCGVAGRRDIDLSGIAARAAEIADATVVASINVTDQSMGRGRSFRDHEYSRRSWVRFLPGEAPERLNTRVLDALKQLNLGGEAVARAMTIDGSN
ncbi:MAG: hypothetical protein WDO17_14930 [Alphaproteobacteria bacterium]